jgi:predicted metal-dependent enzyme (double-stranded beta helix superfamily)
MIRINADAARKLHHDPGRGDTRMADNKRLRDFVQSMTRLAEQGANETRWLSEGRELLAELVAQDDWLPEEFAQPGPSYRQYLLHCDPLERFSVVSFVWGPGQRTPVHDHTVWGLIGMLRGSEIATNYAAQPAGQPMLELGKSTLSPGMVEHVTPNGQDIHVVENAYADRPSISIHCYGGNIGAVRRHVFNPSTGAAKRFISGYTGTVVPNLWDRSEELKAAAAA